MSQYNLRNPAVKRLMKEAEELYQATDEYHAQPLEDNLFEWHFSIRGPPNSDFEGGIYHGRITLPPDYPMKPPSIILLTPNGRFETNKKICLSISGYHPESWQPSWSIRTALLAIIGFMPTHGNGALGSLDYTPAERQQLALKSQEFKCSECGLVKDIFSKKNSLIQEDTTSEKTTVPELPPNNVPDLPSNNMELSTSDEESHKKSENEITQDSPVILSYEEKKDISQSEEAREIGSKRKFDFCDSKSVKMKLADDTNNLRMEDTEQKIQKDECCIYGRYVAAQLKKYSPRTQIIVKHLINNILFQADMEEYNLNLPAKNNSHCFFPTSAMQMQPNNTTPTQIYSPSVTQYSPMASCNSQIRNAIPTLFSNPNPLISELLRQNPGLPGLLAQNPRIPGLVPRFCKQKFP